MKALRITLLYMLAMILFGYIFTSIYKRGFLDLGTYAVSIAFMLVSVIVVFLFMRAFERDEEFRQKIIYMLSKLKLRRKP